MSKPRFVYHWTHRRNLRNILRTGLQTRYAQGRLPAVWVCQYDAMAWALGHVGYHQHWDAGDMVCIRISTRCLRVTFSHVGGVYTIRHDVPPTNIDAVLRHVGEGFATTV